jgi:hypothetical protein
MPTEIKQVFHEQEVSTSQMFSITQQKVPLELVKEPNTISSSSKELVFDWKLHFCDGVSLEMSFTNWITIITTQLSNDAGKQNLLSKKFRLDEIDCCCCSSSSIIFRVGFTIAIICREDEELNIKSASGMVMVMHEFQRDPAVFLINS